MCEKSREFFQRISTELENENEELKRIVETYSDDPDKKLLVHVDLQNIKKELIYFKEKSSGKLIVQFVGITSTGKSSLINCLLRDDRLPVNMLPCTISSIHVSTTPDSKWSVKVDGKELENGDEKERVKKLLKKMGDEATKKQQDNLKITKESVVEFFGPKHLCTRLPDNVVLVDLPGYVENPISTKVVTDSCQKADIIVAVMRIDVPTPEPVSSAGSKFETPLYHANDKSKAYFNSSFRFYNSRRLLP